MSTALFPDRPILLVDDEEAVVASIAALLRSNGISRIIECHDSREVMTLVRENDVEVVLLDLTMPHVTGDELLPQLVSEFPQVPVIVVTGTNEVKAAVDCMKAGAFDYMVKAVEENRLVSGVRRAMEIRKLRRENGRLQETLLSSTLRNPEAFSALVTRNRSMYSVELLAESAARTGEAILITGETGTGKGVLARAVHAASGREGDFVDVNVAGLDDEMFADTLFGHRRGAFTGATDARNGMIQQAAGGTLFMDEIGDLAPASQVKLLRLLDNFEYYPLGSDLAKRTDARVIVATNRDCTALIAEGKFRRDLYYRLSTHELRLPALRERRDDLPLLVDHFLAEACVRLRRQKPAIPADLLGLLEAYEFPGNLRELRSMIFDAASRTLMGALNMQPFRESIGRGAPVPSPRPAAPIFLEHDSLPTIRDATESVIQEAMKRSGGNQSIAAGMLGISRQALSRRLRRRKRRGMA